ncbi:rasGAP-activating-like protein 1 [Gigantopelta aegis]|uniref:rasGAP-activating-like protein 1 n=1 Tax=Gigantopelta aegis TaxID=1735272 RepID=UPI001B88831E|nr:rasGAP-activating-like protein 1 [Gigantopelta aegis]
MCSKHTTLYLRISEAKNLLAKDLNGKSDPYCVIKVDNEVIARTVTVYKSLQPLWAEEFKLHMPFGFQDLAIYVYDEDKVSGDDIIGRVSISRFLLQQNSSAKGVEDWFPLWKVDKDWEIQGEILLEYGIRESENMDPYFVITVIEGRDLAPKDKTGYSDPYITVECLGQTRTTSSQKKTRFPEWHETFEFPMPCIDSELTVTLTVMDKDRIRSDDFMGRIYLTMVDIPCGSLVKSWHSVCHKPLTDSVIRRNSKIERGKLRMKFQLLEENVLPASCYQPLTHLLIQAVAEQSRDLGLVIWHVLEEYRTLELSEVAASLIRFFLGHAVVEYLHQVTVKDIQETADPNTLFRGNSLATKSMDQFMKIVGMPYLHETLSTVIDRIFSEKKNVELDPHRVNSTRRRHSIYRESEEEVLSSSQGVMEGYLSEIMDSIFNSAKKCPRTMRIVFKNLQEAVREKWPEDTHEDTPYLAVSGFLFLRFFAPAILAPKLYAFNTIHPNGKISRTLTLLAKVTQSIGNLTVQHGKETWLHPLERVIRTYVLQARDFIDELVALEDPEDSHYDSGQCRELGSRSVILKQGVLLICRYRSKYLLRLLVLKKCNFWLTCDSLTYAKFSSEQDQKSVPVSQICAVEKVDYGAFNKLNMGQILIRNSDDGIDVLYFQATDVNELTFWMSAIRKTCQYNVCRVETYHPGVYKGEKWSCCHRPPPSAPGCSQTYHGVMLGDWQDPLDPRVETQIIYSQLQNGKHNLRKQQMDLQLQLTDQGADVDMERKLENISQILDIIQQLEMSHDSFKHA